MWKYTHTDEMYHSLTDRNNSTELYHSDVYLGQDFSDGIRHWKYIKREMVNGRWKYYYSHDEYNKARSNYNTAKKNSKVASDKHNTAYDQYRTDRTNLNNHIGTKKSIWTSRKKHQRKTDQLLDKAVKSKRVSDKTWDEASSARTKKEKAEANYNKVAKKTKVQRAVGETTVKVINKASDISYKTKKKVAKGKKAVKNALKKAFPETHTSKTYHGDKVTTTKSVNGKTVSTTTTKNTLTEKVKKRYEKEKQREEKKKKIVKAVKKKLKR